MSAPEEERASKAPSRQKRRPPRNAPAELRVLEFWEKSTVWFLDWTGRWPKSFRFTLAHRLQDHALWIQELLAIARYEPEARAEVLADVNMRLERMRNLLRIARGLGVASGKGFEGAMKRVDETGRMVHGWRKSEGLL